MDDRTVRAILIFKTPTGSLKKNVKWSYFELKALITPSSTSSIAYEKFLKYGKRIIRSSAQELYYLCQISFYEFDPKDEKDPRNLIRERHNLSIEINVGRNSNGQLVFDY